MRIDKYKISRIRILGFTLIAIMATSFILSVVEQFPTLSKSFSEGFKDGSESDANTSSYGPSYFTLIKLVPIQQEPATIPIKDGKITMNYVSLDLKKDIHKPLALVIVEIVVSIVALILLLMFVFLVWEGVALLGKGHIMSLKAVSCIRNIGIILLIIHIIFSTLDFLDIYYLKQQVSVPGYEIAADISFSGMLFSIILLILAEVLKTSIKLQEEQELTI